mgnify:CR=1 FL=1
MISYRCTQKESTRSSTKKQGKRLDQTIAELKPELAFEKFCFGDVKVSHGGDTKSLSKRTKNCL